METVRLYDPDTKTVTEIPARELSSDCILVHVQGIGEVYAEAKKLKLGKAVRHQELPDELLKRIRLLHTILKNVYEKSLEKWEDGFKYDAHPDQEVAIWERIAETFKHFRKSRNRKLQKAVFEVALKCSAAADSEQAPLIISSATLNLLGRDKVEQIVAFYFEQ